MYLTVSLLRVPGPGPGHVRSRHEATRRIIDRISTATARCTCDICNSVPGLLSPLAQEAVRLSSKATNTCSARGPQPSCLKRCASCRSHLTDRKSPIPEVWAAQFGSLGSLVSLCSSIQGTVPSPPARYLEHGCLHSWGSWSVVRAFACRSLGRGSDQKECSN